jgi:hypothetical protein
MAGDVDQPGHMTLGGVVVRLSEHAAQEGWGGPIAFVLALAVGVGLCASLIIIALSPKPIDTGLESVITTLAGAAVGAVGTYLGVSRSGRGAAPAAGNGDASGDQETPESPADAQ